MKNKTPHNPRLPKSLYSLYNHLVKLIQKSPNFLKSITQTIGQWEENEWVFIAKEFPEWDLWTIEFGDILQNAPQWKKVLAEMKKDKVIMNHVGKFTGNPTGARRVELEELIQHFLSSALKTYDGAVINYDTFKTIYDEFVDFFYSKDISVTCRVILDNFRLVDMETLDFGKYIHIRKLNIRDINRLYRELFNTKDHELFRPESSYEICLEFKTKKVLFESGSQSLSMVKDPKYDEVQQQISKALSAIKITVGGGLKKWLTLFEHHAWGYGGSYGAYTIPERMKRGKDSIVQQKDISLIHEVWKIIESEDFKRDLGLQIALRRLLFSLDRDRYDDQLFDIMIGFEALLFKDMKDDDYKGELRYRFSHRAAFFLEDEPQNREKKFLIMRKAYDLRSTLIHGGKPKEPVKIGEKEYKIGDFILSIQEEFRRAILKYLMLPSDKRPDKPERWNKILLTDTKWS